MQNATKKGYALVSTINMGVFGEKMQKQFTSQVSLRPG